MTQATTNLTRAGVSSGMTRLRIWPLNSEERRLRLSWRPAQSATREGLESAMGSSVSFSDVRIFPAANTHETSRMALARKRWSRCEPALNYDPFRRPSVTLVAGKIGDHQNSLTHHTRSQPSTPIRGQRPFRFTARMSNSLNLIEIPQRMLTSLSVGPGSSRASRRDRRSS